jgi:hypothetical protein
VDFRKLIQILPLTNIDNQSRTRHVTFGHQVGEFRQERNRQVIDAEKTTIFE